jgi:hypothetical protein
MWGDLMDILSVIDNSKNFKDIEKEIYSQVCKETCRRLEIVLEGMDKIIREERDKKKYRYKDKRKQTIVTLFGDISYKRTYYKYVDDEGRGHYTFLLDEVLGIKTIGRVSENVMINAVDNATKLSYRKSEEDLTQKMNCNISHQSIWTIVQKAGEWVKKQEEDKMYRFLRGKLKGMKEVKILFEEKDGVYLSIQGEKRKKELKVAKIYEGWEKRTPGSKEYKTINRMYVTGFEHGEYFDIRVNSKIAEQYNIDKLEKKIINADGANWTKVEAEMDANTVQQLDSFHIHQAILRKVKCKKQASILRKYINQGKHEKLFDKLEKLIVTEKDEKEKDKLKELQTYLLENKENLKNYTVRGLKLPEGIEYRTMGTMEGSQHNVICDRMKNRGMSWSIPGAENMSKLLALRHSGMLFDTLEQIYEQEREVSEWTIEELLEIEAKKQYEKEKEARKVLPEGEYKGAGCHFSCLPYEGAKMTESRKVMRRWLSESCV